MKDLTPLQKRILLAALSGHGRIILWVLGNGRFNLPAFHEDVAPAVQGLEQAGLLAPHDAAGRITSAPKTRAPGSYVFELTEAGVKVAQKATGRARGTAPTTPPDAGGMICRALEVERE